MEEEREKREFGQMIFFHGLDRLWWSALAASHKPPRQKVCAPGKGGSGCKLVLARTNYLEAPATGEDSAQQTVRGSILTAHFLGP